jgi:hypothetical protein
MKVFVRRRKIKDDDIADRIEEFGEAFNAEGWEVSKKGFGVSGYYTDESGYSISILASFKNARTNEVLDKPYLRIETFGLWKVPELKHLWGHKPSLAYLPKYEVKDVIKEFDFTTPVKEMVTLAVDIVEDIKEQVASFRADVKRLKREKAKIATTGKKKEEFYHFKQSLEIQDPITRDKWRTVVHIEEDKYGRYYFRDGHRDSRNAGDVAGYYKSPEEALAAYNKEMRDYWHTTIRLT